MDPISIAITNKSWLDTNHSQSVLNQVRLDEYTLEALDVSVQTFLVILYSVTALVAFVGNVTVILVLIHGRRCPLSLRKFLINLSLADVSIALFSIPFTYTDFMLGYWIFPTFMCPIAQFVQVVSVFVSVFTLTTIGIERYVATLHSFNCCNYWLKHHTNLMLIIGWILGALLGSVQVFHSTTVAFRYRNDTYIDCREEWDETSGKAYTALMFGLTFVAPLLMYEYYKCFQFRGFYEFYEPLAFTYGNIGYTIFFYNAPNNSQSLHSQASNKSKTIKMLLAVWILFVLCWLPIQIFQVVLTFRPSVAWSPTPLQYYVFVGTYFTSHWIAMANSCLNPFIYSFMSSNFRKDFVDLRRSAYQKIFAVTTLRIGSNDGL